MVVQSNSVGIFGLETYSVLAEADVSAAFPAFDIVGLPDASVKESRNRVRSAMVNCGYEFPDGKITVNLAPANIRKEGPMYDLPILVALLQGSRQLKCDLSQSAFIGELSLGGEVRSVNGALPMAIQAQKDGIKDLYLPADNAAEASVVDNINIYGIHHITELIAHLCGIKALSPTSKNAALVTEPNEHLPDFSQVRGQAEAKRALEIAAAGFHNILLVGPPGSGKSMLAKRVPSILPNMTFEEMIEITKIYSVAGALQGDTPLITTRPFRAPHHTVSAAGLSGGGSIPKPGEISLAHNGVLFLDELPEFVRGTMEVLRQPLEDGTVTISRVNGTLTYPCNVMLVAAMNPCPCGYYGHPTRPCVCSDKAVARYLSHISGPLLDRLDIHIEVPPVEFDELNSTAAEEPSKEIRKRVNKARQVQNERYKDEKFNCNSRITAGEMARVCPMDDKAKTILHTAFDKMGLSARAYDKVLKVARTIADMEESEVIHSDHIAEAVQYRALDRKYWHNS